MTHGESVETIWSHSTSLATWSRDNGPQARHAFLDAHWSGWNWRKLINLREPRTYFLVPPLTFDPSRQAAEDEPRKGLEVLKSPEQ